MDYEKSQIILHGDCLDEMKKMPDNSIDCIVTDPPYFLTNNCGSGFMNKSWDSIHGLYKYLWESNTFVNSALNLLNVLKLEINTEEENTAPYHVNLQLSKKTKENLSNVLFAKENLSHGTVQKNDSVLLLVLTKQEVWDLLKELCLSHMQIVESFQNGVKENAVFVLPISLLVKELNSIAHKSVLQKLKVNDLEAKEIPLTSMDHLVLQNAIEVMIGMKSEKQFTLGINGFVNTAIKNAYEKKFNVITLSHLKREELMTWITSLLCAINAILSSNTIPNYLIENFYVQIFKEALRICKPGANLLAFSGTRTNHKLANALEKSGFEIFDSIYWVHGQGFPKSKNNFGLEGYGTALKPAVEPAILCRKPVEKTFAQNAEKWGVAGINIDKCRVGEIPSARWPSNLILDESAAEELDQMSGQLSQCGGYKKTTHDKGIFGIGTPQKQIFKEEIRGASRFFYVAKASSSERQGSKHPTIKPKKLISYLIKLVCPPNKEAIILDPFMGSGTTGICCKELGINFIGIEKELDYFEDAKRRIDLAKSPDLELNLENE